MAIYNLENGMGTKVSKSNAKKLSCFDELFLLTIQIMLTQLIEITVTLEAICLFQLSIDKYLLK